MRRGLANARDRPDTHRLDHLCPCHLSRSGTPIDPLSRKATLIAGPAAGPTERVAAVRVAGIGNTVRVMTPIHAMVERDPGSSAFTGVGERCREGTKCSPKWAIPSSSHAWSWFIAR